jgi:hypothetical protein
LIGGERGLAEMQVVTAAEQGEKRDQEKTISTHDVEGLRRNGYK